MRECKDGKLRPYCARRTQEEFARDFWSRVSIPTNDPVACWEWGGALHGKGTLVCYGSVWINGKKWKTHRLSYFLTHGEIPEGMFVCHHCDNPKCVRPDHLFLGTSKDNHADMISKGRENKERGEDRYNATLTESDVKAIRASYSFRGRTGLSGKQLSQKYGVNRSMISAILKRKRWKHV